MNSVGLLINSFSYEIVIRVLVQTSPLAERFDAHRSNSFGEREYPIKMPWTTSISSINTPIHLPTNAYPFVHLLIITSPKACSFLTVSIQLFRPISLTVCTVFCPHPQDSLPFIPYSNQRLDPQESLQVKYLLGSSRSPSPSPSRVHHLRRRR